ncbi:hypothetical protein [Sphingosinicella microcystinivorans]|uniref:hypothetical protein n=1 Tax=Sphingosinicella microcystinivorans TaxID=335406 RepID=UPI0022F3AB99|nr:hypothetical protein [Sphingosinicella microcystinivorans]WBX85213.1 hypothetical protein PE061_04605 [Sphingosinicella microcystinivorans]
MSDKKKRRLSYGFTLLILPAALVTLSAAIGADAATSPRQGEAFFDDRVLPALAENGCALCHGQNYVRPRVLEYRELLPFLSMGSGPENNVLITKMANLRSIRADRPTHPGGQRCKSIDAEPCKTFRLWWEIEFGEPSRPSAGDK